MSDHQPKKVKHNQVPPPLFGPWGRKWIDISGLTARYKIAQGPESIPEMGKPQQPAKPTARTPGPKGSRQQTSGDLNAPENVSSSQASKPNKPGDDEGNFYIPGDPNAPSLSLEGEVGDDFYIKDPYEDVSNTKPEGDFNEFELNPDWQVGDEDRRPDLDERPKSWAESADDLLKQQLADAEKHPREAENLEYEALNRWARSYMQPGRFMKPDEWIGEFAGALPTEAGDRYCKENAERLVNLAKQQGITDKEQLKMVWDAAFYQARRAWLEYTTGGEEV